MVVPAETTIKDLVERCAELEIKNAELKAKVEWFEDQHRFGSSSEKTDPNQGMLFNEAEATADDSAVEPSLEEITYKRRKAVGKRDEQLADLPVETVEYALTEE